MEAGGNGILISDIANAITAVCALIAIFVTIAENKKLHDQTIELEERRFLSSIFEDV